MIMKTVYVNESLCNLRFDAAGMVGVHVSMSVSEHVRTVVNSCAQIMHAIRILRSRGMGERGLPVV